MSEDPQSRYERDLELDRRLESSEREGLTGTTGASIYEPPLVPDQASLPPKSVEPGEEPRWRRDFAVDWPEDNYVARRDFVKFLVLTSGAFVAGQGWIAAQSLIKSRRPSPSPRRVATLSEIAPGSVLVFDFPGEHDPCLLIRTESGELLAYGQKCTHLSCAVVPRLAEGVIHCPCHEGYFDLLTGRNIAGPPPRPLPKVVVEVRGDEVWAISVEERTV
ncbi:MAG TPA: Rieske (2Fe-2S) protein [Polyangiaceae bacterium]|nr:Rieske (2Fe-2S) protein [Polyangiaceae bacterium]